MCGEHGTPTNTNDTPKGSSPRVRGTPLSIGNAGEWRGIIPACAGNTGWRPACRRGGWDHPRVCGEHLKDHTSHSWMAGSSPRVRGTREDQWWEDGPNGIIPACAGNTMKSIFSDDNTRDHPRVCGEHRVGVQLPVQVPGSSPRVRGTRTMTPTRFVKRGIIPACAGNTQTVSGQESSAGDHPRVCGEHRRNGTDRNAPRGSSPRVRGTHVGQRLR